MTKFLSIILIYVVLIIIVGLTYVLVAYILKLVFSRKKEPSPAEPIIKGISVLAAVFEGRSELAVPLINIGIQLINAEFHTNLTLIIETETQPRVVETVALFVVVGTILVFYIIYALKQDALLKQMTDAPSEREAVKIDFPKDEIAQSPIFAERIKLLFELKFEQDKLKLTFDNVDNVLYGFYTHGLHSYLVIIYCQISINHQVITGAEIKIKRNQLDQIAEKLQGTADGYQNSYYYLIENGAFEPHEIDNIACYSENDFLNKLIDFSTYLKKLINKFKSDKLPFSSADDDEGKYTLNETFIQPDFQVSDKDLSVNLEVHIDKWLQQSNRKHMLILGDYGMGKSTYMKYYANHLAKNILENKPVKRFPVFISLTNTSPRHGGIDNAIGKFVSDNLGVSRALFDILVKSGKIVFLLDGFDEMGYVGTHEQRMKQLNAIWQIATKNNKLIITGRPSYFPTEQELIDSFNIKEQEHELTPMENPYFEKITLEGFTDDQIRESILRYKFTEEDQQKYIDFIFENQNILDLCSRPSMMHIIREMLPKLYSAHETKNLNPGNLMRQYIDHWINRQLEKDIVSAIEDKQQKREFVWSFFSDLAKIYFVKRIDTMPAAEISQIIKSKTLKLKLTDASDIDGFETELLSGFFIEIEDIGYKFVHKSFKEFFIASEIIKALTEKKFKDPLLYEFKWTKEINDFVFDGYLQYGELILDHDMTPCIWSWYGYSKNHKRVFKYIARRYVNTLNMMRKHRTKPSGIRFLNFVFIASNPFNMIVLFSGDLFPGLVTRNRTESAEHFALFSYYYCYLRDNSLINNELIKDIVDYLEN